MQSDVKSQRAQTNTFQDIQKPLVRHSRRRRASFSSCAQGCKRIASAVQTLWQPLHCPRAHARHASTTTYAHCNRRRGICSDLRKVELSKGSQHSQPYGTTSAHESSLETQQRPVSQICAVQGETQHPSFCLALHFHPRHRHQTFI